MWKNTSTTNATSPISVASPAVAAPTYRLKYQGRRFAQIVKLKPEFEEQYKECHANVWPQVLKQIKDCNIEDCKHPGSAMATRIHAAGVELRWPLWYLCSTH
jgi:hypothetical protein